MFAANPRRTKGTTQVQGDQANPAHVGDTVRVDTADGPMWTFRSDVYVSRSLQLYGEYVAGEADIFRQIVRPGMHVVEIGANIGSHSVMLARACAPGRFLAFEPQQRAFQLLTANLVANDVANARVYPEAIGAAEGMVEMSEPDYTLRGNFGAFSLTNPRRDHGQGLRVRVSSLDSWALGACHFLKIDVEGLECDVIAGASATIATHRPIIYTENDRRDQQGRLIDMLAAHGYVLYWHLPPLFRPGNFKAVTRNVFENLVSVNMLCVPAELNATIDGFVRIDPANWEPPLRRSRGDIAPRG
jgi:FkbM family methyltransferase